jgi:ribulose-phosphate 3-epimerase
MVEIIPAINADSFEEAQQKIKLVEPFFSSDGTGWVQIDMADGTYTKNTIWHNPQELASIETPLNIEVHLMILDMERRVEDWLLPNVKRIIFHIETVYDSTFVINRCKDASKEVGLAVSPGIPWTRVAPFKDKADIFQILGVYPGLAGQKTIEETYDKIKDLKKFCKSCIIEVDGGMNKETARKAVDAGADKIVAANAIYKDDNIEKNIKELYESLKR